MKPGLPVWRSLLYVPANVDKYVDKAHERGADCIQLDLEDSVPAAEKERARTLVPAAAKRVRRGGADVIVRINRPLSLAVRDLEACVGPDVDGFAITKVEGPDHLRLLDELVSELEARRGIAHGRTKFLAMIETPSAYFRMAEIAGAVERTVAMNIGGEDFALESGMAPVEETLLLPKQQMIFAARAAGIMPMGFIASVAGFRGLPGSGAYSASKAAAIAYLESLRVELVGSGVAVVTVCPGFVATPMTARNPYPMPFLLPPDRAAALIARAVARRRRFYVLPWPMAWIGRLLRVAPRSLYDRVLAGRKRKPRDAG